MPVHIDEVQMQRALRLSTEGYAYAALEALHCLLQNEELDATSRSLVYDEIGKLLVQQNQVEAARRAFTMALSDANSIDEQSKCQIHLAMTYYAQSDYDRAYRLLSEIENSYGPDLPMLRRAVLFNNLGTIQWATQFYRDAVDSIQTSLRFFETSGFTGYHSQLKANLGICYTELRSYDEAQVQLHQAIETAEDNLLFAYTALSRLHLLRGDYEQSMVYIRKSLPLFDEFPQLVDPLKTAIICRIHAELAFHSGHLRLAKQLMEKAELQFGILGQWREWGEARARIEEWERAGLPQGIQLSDALPMQRFLLIVEAWNTQELIGHGFSEFIDTRVMMAAKLASTLGFSEEDKSHVVTAARLADYGLTAIDPEVIENPARSDSAWQQYLVHPVLGADMLQELALPKSVYELIESHHERQDGTGFPRGTRGKLEVTHSVLQLADAYASSVVLNKQPHSQTIATLQETSAGFDPDVLSSFVGLFA